MKIGCFLQHLDILKHTKQITEVKKKKVLMNLMVLRDMTLCGLLYKLLFPYS